MRRLIVAITLAAVLGMSASEAQAAPGDLDTSFGSGGTATIDLGAGLDDSGRDAVADSSGNTVVVGASATGPEEASAAVARLTPAGALDLSFGGGDGVVSFPFGADDDNRATAVAIDGSGRIVVAGYTTFDFAVARLTSAGQLDPTFGGGDGKVTTASPGFFARTADLLIDPSGRIVVGGSEGDDFALLRYTSSGTLDTGFDSDGIVTTSFGSAFSGVIGIALDTQQRLLALGSTSTAGAAELAVSRYTEGGALDTSYSSDGRVTAPLGADRFIEEVALDSHNRIVLAGDFVKEGEPFHYFLARYTPTGMLDSTFAGDGMHRGEDDSLVSAMTLDPQDRILLAGHTSALPGHEDGLTRIVPDGSLDPAFGGGQGVAPLPHDIFDALALDSSQRVLVAGSGFGSDSDFAVTRLLGGGPAPPEPSRITVGPAGNGSGTVESSPSGIVCAPECAAVFGDGQAVTLNANAAGGSEFAGWTAVAGDPGTCVGTATPCDVEANGYVELEAGFTKMPGASHEITVLKAGTGSGTVSSAPFGIDCGPVCSHAFEEGLELVLTATPSAGSTFAGWSGSGCSGTGACQLTMSADGTVSATFDTEPAETGGDTSPITLAQAAPAPSPQSESTEYSWCISAARRAYAKSRKVAKRKAKRGRALVAAKRRHAKAVAMCRSRFDR